MVTRRTEPVDFLELAVRNLLVTDDARIEGDLTVIGTLTVSSTIVFLGTLTVNVGAAGTAAYQAQVAGVTRWQVTGDGTTTWHDGAGAADVSLSRTAADVLTLAAGDSFAIADLTTGSVLFAAANGVISQDNPNLFWDDGNDRLGIGTATPARTLHSEEDDASNTSVTEMLRLTHTTSGAPGVGIGAGMEFEVETSAGNNEIGALIEAITTNVGAGTEAFDLVFSTMTAGAAAAPRMTLNAAGLTFAAAAILATAAGNLTVSAAGDVVLTSNIILNDNVTLQFGDAGAESAISSDGTNTVWNMTSGVLTLLGSNIVLGAGEGGTTAPTGQTLRAPDAVTGGAGNVAGADILVAAGIGTGTGDVGTIIFQLPIEAAAGDNIQTRATRLTLDMVDSSSVLTMLSAQALEILTATGNLNLSSAVGFDVLIGEIGSPLVFVDGAFGTVGFGAAASNRRAVSIAGTYSFVGTAALFDVNGTINMADAGNGNLVSIGGTINVASGALFAGLNVGALTLTGTTPAEAASVRIVGPSTGATLNYALWVDDGLFRLDGDLDVAAQAFDVTVIAGTNQAFRILDSVDTWYQIDTRQTTAGVTSHVYNVADYTIASGAGNIATAGRYQAYVLNYTGTTQVTSTVIGWDFGQATLVGDTATLTVDKATTIQVIAPVQSTNISLTDTSAILVLNNGGGAATNQYGFFIEALTSATNNYGVWIETPTGTIADAIHVVGGRTFLGGNLKVDGGLVDVSAVASDIAAIADTAAALEITDGTAAFYTFDTRVTAAGISSHRLDNADITIASGATNRAQLAVFGSWTLNYTGTTQVTSLVSSTQFGAVSIVGDTATLTVDKATNLLLVAPIEGANILLTDTSSLRIIDALAGTPTNQYGVIIEALTVGTNNYGVWIETPTGTIADAIHVVGGRTYIGGNLAVDNGSRILSAGATEIGIQVTNGALTVGSLGSLVVPVKTDTGAPNDAAMGNTDGAFGFNSADSTLEIRLGADNYIGVGVAGVVIQRKAPVISTMDGWYHPQQYMDASLDYVDESRCIQCGEEMQPGDKMMLYANGRVRNDDLHAIFGHDHIELSPVVQELQREVKELKEQLAVAIQR